MKTGIGKMTSNEKYEKRCEARTRREIPIVFIHKKRDLDACTLNYSKNGLGIKIFRKVALPVGDMIDLSTMNFSTKAQVVWTKNEIDPHITLVGLKVVDGAVNLKRARKDAHLTMGRVKYISLNSQSPIRNPK
jgi:hypothetical protein